MCHELDTDIQCEEVYTEEFGIFDGDGDFYSINDLFTFDDNFDPLYEKYENTHKKEVTNL